MSHVKKALILCLAVACASVPLVNTGVEGTLERLHHLKLISDNGPEQLLIPIGLLDGTAGIAQAWEPRQCVPR